MVEGNGTRGKRETKNGSKKDNNQQGRERRVQGSWEEEEETRKRLRQKDTAKCHKDQVRRVKGSAFATATRTLPWTVAMIMGLILLSSGHSIRAISPPGCPAQEGIRRRGMHTNYTTRRSSDHHRHHSSTHATHQARKHSNAAPLKTSIAGSLSPASDTPNIKVALRLALVINTFTGCAGPPPVGGATSTLCAAHSAWRKGRRGQNRGWKRREDNTHTLQEGAPTATKEDLLVTPADGGTIHQPKKRTPWSRRLICVNNPLDPQIDV